MIKIMASHPAFDVNAQATDGWTLLTMATVTNQSAVVEWLLTQPGIQINLADDDGFTALALASSKGLSYIAKLLSSHVPTTHCSTCTRKQQGRDDDSHKDPTLE